MTKSLNFYGVCYFFLFSVCNFALIYFTRCCALFLFLYFLEKNGILRTKNGEKRIADNTLVALTLMIAVSKSKEKDTMVKIIVNLINKNNK